MPRLSPFRPLLRLATRTTPTVPAVAPAASSYAPSASSITRPLSAPLFRSAPSSPSVSVLRTTSPILTLLSAARTPTSATQGSTAASVLGQVRGVTYGSEYQPSQRIRKRRHGFLSRNKTRNGRKTIMRRKFRGKAKLSH